MFAWGNEEEEYAFANLTGAAKFTFSHVGCSHVKFSFLTTTACKLSGTFPLSLDSDAAKVRWSAAETEAAAERGVTYYADVERDGSVSFYVPYAAGTIWAWSHLTLEDADNAEADPLYSNTKINNIVVAKNRIAVLPTLDIDWAGEPSFPSAYGIDWRGISASSNTNDEYPAIQTLKATADEDYVYLYLEVDPTVLTRTHTFDHQFRVYVTDAGSSRNYYWNSACSYINKDIWAVSGGEMTFLSFNPTPFESNMKVTDSVVYFEVRISRTHDTTSALLSASGEVGIGVELDDLYVDGEWKRLNNFKPYGVIPTYGSSMYPVTLAHGQEAPTDVTYTVQVTDNWVYENQPSFTIRAENPTASDVTANVQITIKTDQLSNATTVATISDSKTVPAGETRDIVVTTTGTVAPGFYKATVSVNGTQIRDSFVFGVSPTQIVSAPDKQSDFDSFWTTAKNQLKGISMNATLTEITSASSSARKVYLVEMNSIPDGTSGTPVVIRGYYCEPTDGDRPPVIIHFFGYDSQHPSGTLGVPSGGSSGTYAEFYLSNRGQYVNNRTAAQRSDGINRDFSNIYGDWFAWHFGDKNSYYYRGAYMDCVQAVRFLATRATSDMDNVFAEGTSQGGAFTYACAALSAPEYPLRAIAPGVSLMGDFPDYFQIVSWPGNTAKANKGSMTDAQMYAFLSYFDMKNLATYITCPVIACSSLQDRTCPPHTNRAPYNNLGSSVKEIHYNPLLGHAVSSEWSSQYKAFFESQMH